MYSTDLPLHADGTLDVAALIGRHRALFGDTRMEDDGGGDGDGDGGDGDGDGDGGEFTPITSQEDFNKRIKDRVRRAKQKGYGEAEAKFKPGHEKHQALENELASEKDKAVKAATDEANKQAHEKFVPQLVRQAFRAEAKGVLSKDQLAGLIEDLDLSKYVTDDGDVDEDKIEAKVKKIAGDGAGGGDNNKGGGSGNRSLGQGKQQQSNAKPGDSGRAMAEKRFGKKDS